MICQRTECKEIAITSDFASSSYNGEWEEYGTCNGKVSYKHIDQNLYLFRNQWDSATWIDGTYCGSSVDYYYWWGGQNDWQSLSGTSVSGSVEYSTDCTEGIVYSRNVFFGTISFSSSPFDHLVIW